MILTTNSSLVLLYVYFYFILCLFLFCVVRGRQVLMTFS